MARAQLEEIIAQLLLPDSNAITAATAKLKEVIKEPAVIPALCEILTGCENTAVRQYAATILRQKVEKCWSKLDEGFQGGVKTTCLTVLAQGPAKEVRNSVTGVVSVIAKHQFESWPELLNFLTEACMNEATQQLGLYVMGVISDAVAMEMEPHYPALFQLYAGTLSSATPEVLYLTCIAMSKLVLFIGTDNVKPFASLLPASIKAVHSLLSADEEKACQSLELFENLLECEVPVIVPHLTDLTELCLEVAQSTALEDATRVKFMTFLNWLIAAKKKTIQKLKLVERVLGVVFKLLATPEPEDTESETPIQYAGIILDTIALHLPADKLVPALLQTYILPGVGSSEPLDRKAGLVALAVIAEGCGEYLVEHHLQECLKLAAGGLQDGSDEVRNAALYALGQFAEHLQPEISKYSGEILPILCSKISHDMGSENSALTRTYYALESLCENMGEKIVPFLPSLIEKLVSILSGTGSNSSKEMAISAIGAVTSAAEQEIVPFLPQIMEHMKVYLMAPNSEEVLSLKTQAIDTLGIFARSVGKEVFLGMAEECVQLGVSNLETAEDPDLKRCLYGLFAAISSTHPEVLVNVIEPLVQKMFESLDSTEGMTTSYKDSSLLRFDLGESEDEEEEGEEDDDHVLGDYENIEGIVVENSYLEEKTDTLASLAELSIMMGPAFAPFIEESFSYALKMADFSSPPVRKSAMLCLSQTAIALHKLIHNHNYQDESALLPKMLSVSVPHLLEVVKTDKERELVCGALESINEMLKVIGAEMGGNDAFLDELIEIVKDVLSCGTACQKDEEDDTYSEEVDDESELATVLLDYAASILPTLATAIGGAKFAPFYKMFLPLLLPKNNLCKKNWASGTVAELIQKTGPAVTPFAETLLNYFLKGMKDSSPDVVSNCVFGIGALAEACGPALAGQYPKFLEVLAPLLKENGDGRTMDNVLGAVARMIKTQPDAVNLSLVLPAFVQWLPLREDMEENETVYSCLRYLLGAGALNTHLPSLVPIFAAELSNRKVGDEGRAELAQIMTAIMTGYPELMKSFGQEDLAKLQGLLVNNGS